MGFIFKYSDRSGTPSVGFEDKVENKELERRNQELLQLLEGQSYASNQKLVGTKVEVLVEGRARKGEGQLMGRTSCFRKVNFLGDAALIGDLKHIYITNATTSSLQGDLVL